MLLSDDGQYAIPTASKAGTTALEAALVGRGFHLRHPRYGTYIPSTHHNATVLFMVRHPYARLVALYRHGVANPGTWLHQIGVNGFEAFCHSWAIARHHHQRADWTTTFNDYTNAAMRTNRCVTMHKLEEKGVAAFMELLAPAYPRINTRVRERMETCWRPLWTPAALDAVEGLLDADLDHGGYKKPKAA